MDTIVERPVRRRPKYTAAPWERTLHKLWPSILKTLLGAIAICLAVLLISLIIAAI